MTRKVDLKPDMKLQVDKKKLHKKTKSLHYMALKVAIFKMKIFPF